MFLYHPFCNVFRLLFVLLLSTSNNNPPHARRNAVVYAVRVALGTAVGEERQWAAVAQRIAAIFRAPAHQLAQILARTGRRFCTRIRTTLTHSCKCLRLLLYRVLDCIFCELQSILEAFVLVRIIILPRNK